MTRTCAYCQKEYTPTKYTRERGYCSKQCYYDRIEVGMENERWKPAPPPELPESIDCPRCAKAMTLDLLFDREARITGHQTRRWYCVTGHTHYYPPPIKTLELPRCGTHTAYTLPCEACKNMVAARLRTAASKAGRTHRGKHSGNAWKTEIPLAFGKAAGA